MTELGTRPLRDLCIFRHGGTPSKSNPNFWAGDIPWVSPKDMKQAVIDSATDYISAEAVAGSAASIVPSGSILAVVRSGILAHSFPIAQVAKPLAFNQDIKAVIPVSEDVDPHYLYWFLRSQSRNVVTRGVKKGATVHSVQSGFIENLQVPMRPREDQRRIVDLLARAEGIVRLRREAQQKAAELIPAIFIDMFGDPATNPKRWPTLAIQRLCPVHTGATPRKEERRYYDGGTVPWVRTGEVRGGTIVQVQERITELAVAETNCKVFPVNTVLVAMYGQGQTRGRAGMLKTPAATNQACAAILPSGDIDPRFLFEVLNLQYERLRAMGRGGNQANLNLGMIKELEVPCPPLDLQLRFVDRSSAMESILGQQAEALAKSMVAFDALLGRAFG
jgi:type I restriction enzyme, S subunit